MEGIFQNLIVTGSIKDHGESNIPVKSSNIDIETNFNDKSAIDLRYEMIHQSAVYMLERTHHRPKIGIICGSGLGGLADLLCDQDVFPYAEIPHFPLSTVVGHAGRMVIGELNNIPVMCMQGRLHAYEGYPLWKCAMPVRVMKLMGVEKILITNAAGSLNKEYNVGDIMIIKDHINLQELSGNSPLKGYNDERFGPRFPSMHNAYDKDFRKKAKVVAAEMNLGNVLREGVYIMDGGPSYETIAEHRMMRNFGVDAVGMSTVHEVVVARHCSMKVFAFSLISNKCIMEYDTDDTIDHTEVIDVANKRKSVVQEFACRIIGAMNEDEESPRFFDKGGAKAPPSSHQGEAFDVKGRA